MLWIEPVCGLLAPSSVSTHAAACRVKLGSGLCCPSVVCCKYVYMLTVSAGTCITGGGAGGGLAP